jgi:WD40 repeat protein
MPKKMRRQFSISLYAAVLLLVSFSPHLPLAAQTRIGLMESQEAEKKAAAAYQAKNFPGFLENMIAAGKLRPNHPRLLYNLADAYALNNKPGEACKALSLLADMGLYFQPEKDDDFASAANLNAFKTLVNKFATIKQPVNKSERAFTVPEKELIVEGLTIDPGSGDFFLGSIHQRKIVVRKKDGTIKDFSSPSDGLYSVLGMAVDAKRRILWAVSSGFSQMKNFDPADDGKAGIFKYDLKTGKLLNKYLLSNEDGNHALGDLTVSKNGDVFASDSMSPAIYKIAAGTDKLEVFLKSDSFASLQGLTFSPDEKYLFAADYSLGFFRIDMSSKNILQLAPAANTAVLGADGIYFHQGSIIAIQNGVNPQRVVQFTLDPAFTKITGYKTLEANHADFNEPTLGVLNGNDFYFNANSQWAFVSDKGELDKEKLKEPVILKIALAGKK